MNTELGKTNEAHRFKLHLVDKRSNICQRELQQIVFNHSSDIDFNNFEKIYKKCTAKPYYFLVIHATLSSNIFLHFRCKVLEKLYKTT